MLQRLSAESAILHKRNASPYIHLGKWLDSNSTTFCIHFLENLSRNHHCPSELWSWLWYGKKWVIDITLSFSWKLLQTEGCTWSVGVVSPGSLVVDRMRVYEKGILVGQKKWNESRFAIAWVRRRGRLQCSRVIELQNGVARRKVSYPILSYPCSVRSRVCVYTDSSGFFSRSPTIHIDQLALKGRRLDTLV